MLLVSIADPSSLLVRFLESMSEGESTVVYVIYPGIPQQGCYESEKSYTSLNPVGDVDLLNLATLPFPTSGWTYTPIPPMSEFT